MSEQKYDAPTLNRLALRLRAVEAAVAALAAVNEELPSINPTPYNILFQQARAIREAPIKADEKEVVVDVEMVEIVKIDIKYWQNRVAANKRDNYRDSSGVHNLTPSPQPHQ